MPTVGWADAELITPTRLNDLDAGRHNLLVNGGFEVWQRGAGPFNTTNDYTADRWVIFEGGTSNVQVDRNTAQADTPSQYCAAIVYTHNTLSSLFQRFAISTDAASVHQLRGKQISFSCRIRTSTASACRIRLEDYDGTNLGTANSSYHTGGGGYETLYVTLTVQTDATRIEATILLEATATIYADNAMLVVGSVPTAYVPMHQADELARCQRYFEVRGAGVSFGIGVGQAISTTSARAFLNFLVEKAVSPTITVNNPTNFFTTDATNAELACTALTGSAEGLASTTLVVTVASGLVAGNATRLKSNNANATIYIEANP